MPVSTMRCTPLPAPMAVSRLIVLDAWQLQLLRWQRRQLLEWLDDREGLGLEGDGCLSVEGPGESPRSGDVIPVPGSSAEGLDMSVLLTVTEGVRPEEVAWSEPCFSFGGVPGWL
jgi:hypothetical protein